ncbi:MAG: DUF433 domain-containing protein [Rhodothermales bacterium]|nr:DUF433 domain-containing protein [Rhodothermales bacterium]MBO6778996.1 DUF433 domain-containing protein [Rhodothermales bacterium]
MQELVHRGMDWREHITVDPDICHGKAHFRGTRIPTTVVLDLLAEGHTQETILAEYPSLSAETIRAALSFAAELASERVVTWHS